MRLDVKLEQRSALVANLRAFDRQLQADVRRLNREQAAEALEVAQRIAPRDTGFMASQIRTDFSEGGLRWSVGWAQEDFTSRGFFPYYLVQEFGSVYQAPQPTLRPTFQAVEPQYRARLSELLRASVQRMKER